MSKGFSDWAWAWGQDPCLSSSVPSPQDKSTSGAAFIPDGESDGSDTHQWDCERPGHTLTTCSKALVQIMTTFCLEFGSMGHENIFLNEME